MFSCQWYDGYRFGKTEIFNPWSVVNYFSNQCEPRPFWVSTGSNVYTTPCAWNSGLLRETNLHSVSLLRVGL